MTASRVAPLLCACLSWMGCDGCQGAASGAAAPASAWPLASSGVRGEALGVGTIVAAVEKSGGVRIYKIKKLKYFPEPLSEELVMIAYHEKGKDFQDAARLFHGGGLTVELPNVRVYRHVFIRRDHRILGQQPVTPADLSATARAARALPVKRR